MMRSLWTAASGMTVQQINLDTIANNLANVNTIGYKTETAEFKTLLYQNLQTRTTTANGEQKPVSAQVGLGVRNSAITSHYTDGQLLDSESQFSFAINGNGFFAIRANDGQTYYTRNGAFVLSRAMEGSMLCTSEGYPVLDSNGQPIVFGDDITTSSITINTDGEVCYPDESNNPQPTGVKIGLFQFLNPSGLSKTYSSLLAETGASGAAMNEETTQDLNKSLIKQKYLEGSNVQVAKEMVSMITAQRAYELNSKAIQASDDMLQQANNLKR